MPMIWRLVVGLLQQAEWIMLHSTPEHGCVVPCSFFAMRIRYFGNTRLLLCLASFPNHALQRHIAMAW